MSISWKLFLSVALILSLSAGLSAQAWAVGIPAVLPAGLQDYIVDLMEQNAGLSPDELAVEANDRLALVGFDYEFDPCDLKTTPTNRIFPRDEAGVYHAYRLTGRDGKKVSILAREPGDAPCGCWVKLPVRSITKRAITIFADATIHSVVVPKGLLLEEVSLVDNTLKKSVRNWVAPHGGPPDGISNEGTKLYFEIDETPLYLEITAADGRLRIVPKAAGGLITKFTDLTRFPKDPNNDYLGFRRFTDGKKSFTVKFSHTCS